MSSYAQRVPSRQRFTFVPALCPTVFSNPLLKQWNWNQCCKITDMPNVGCTIPRSLEIAVDRYIERTKQSASAVVTEALSQFLKHPLHTLFQVSTSGALVRGVYQRAVSVEVLKQHGDFGLGTFDDLDGEMAVLEGHVHQARADGTVCEVPDSVTAPFAVITRFEADARGQIPYVGSLSELVARCDQYRESDNLFFAIRIDGHFDYVHTRAVRATNKPLAQAAAVQPEFSFRQLDGTLVGIWSPGFSSAFSIPGYHFHFLSSDRTKGGHLLDCSGRNLAMQVERLTEFHISLPESEEFLKADLSKDPSAELASAEGIRK
jgi:acetolactate decarboxylase